MNRTTLSRIIPIALIAIITIVAIAALIGLGQAIFSGNNSSAPSEVDTSQQALLDTSGDHSVGMTVRGPIVANENFRSYQIIVSTDQRQMTTYEGYRDNTLEQITLPNNLPAYTQFVYALDKAALVKGTAFEGDADDTRGVCATGRLYEFEIYNDGNVVNRLWTSSCKGSKGSLDASAEQLRNLFLLQIPDAKRLINAIDL